MLKSTQSTTTPLSEYYTVLLLRKNNTRTKPHNLGQQKDLRLMTEQ